MKIKKYPVFKVLYMVLFVVLILFTSVFSREKSDREEAERINPLLRNAKTIRITLIQKFPGGPKFSNLERQISSVLELADLKVVEKENDNADLELKVSVSGEALGAYYYRKVYAYTGASIWGTIIFKHRDKVFVKKRFKGYIKPSVFSDGTCSSKSKAPFLITFVKSGFNQKLFKIFGEYFGKPFLLNALRSENSKIEAIKMIEKRKDSDKVQLLITALDDRDQFVRKAAVEALGRTKDTRAIKPIKKTLMEDKMHIIKASAKALHALNWTPESVNVKVRYLSIMKKWKTIVKLGEAGVDALISLFSCNNRRFVQEVIATIVKIGEPAVPHLILALNNKKDGVAKNSAITLGKLGDHRAMEPLINALGTNKLIFVSMYSSQALRELTNQDFGKDASKWRNWWDKNKKDFIKK